MNSDEQSIFDDVHRTLSHDAEEKKLDLIISVREVMGICGPGRLTTEMGTS